MQNRKANQFDFFLFWFPNQRVSLMYETNLGNQRHKFICEAFHVADDSAADTPGMGSGVFIFIRNVCHQVNSIYRFVLFAFINNVKSSNESRNGRSIEVRKRSFSTTSGFSDFVRNRSRQRKSRSRCRFTIDIDFRLCLFLFALPLPRTVTDGSPKKTSLQFRRF